MPGSQYDVVVGGAGAAGLACAIRAASLGLKTLVLEKSRRIGAGTGVSAGLIWIGANHLGASAGNTDSLADVADYLHYVGASGLDPARMERFIEEGPRALRFLEAAGIAFRLTSHADQYFGVAPGAKPCGRVLEAAPIAADDVADGGIDDTRPPSALYRSGSAALINRDRVAEEAPSRTAASQMQDVRAAGPGLLSWLLKVAVARGVEIRTERAVHKLAIEAARVCGVLTGDGEAIRAGRGVVVASGGYESDRALSANFEALPGWRSMFPPAVSGDGLIMAAEIGAAVRLVPNNLSTFHGPRANAPCRRSPCASASTRTGSM